jgi:hypothetical protein
MNVAGEARFSEFAEAEKRSLETYEKSQGNLELPRQYEGTTRS